jgi:hypothetical protein
LAYVLSIWCCWKPVNEKQFEVRLSAFGPETSSERCKMETATTLDEDNGKQVKIYSDGSKMGDKVGRSRNTVFSEEQYAIIEAI